MVSISPNSAFREPRLAWLLAGLVTLLAAAWGGWSAWLRWYALLMAAYALSDAAFSLLDSISERQELQISVVRAMVAAVTGSVASSVILNLVDGITLAAPATWQFDMGVSFLFAAVLLVSKVLEREALRHVAHERQVVELKFNALQAQIEPHFIYNTLGNVQQLVRTAPVEAERMLESLVNYLRVAIPEVRSGRASVGQEVRRAEAYLNIMSTRMRGRLKYEIQVPDELRALPVPPLSLMTLVENAVKHGVDAKPDGGFVRIVGMRKNGKLQLRVIDEGAGFATDAGGGTGLTNLRERLHTIYGSRAALELMNIEPFGVEATLELPID